MFCEMNMFTKKLISLIIILVIFMSCIMVIAIDAGMDFKNYNISEKLSNINVVDAYYEMLILNLAEDKYSERNYKINNSDRIAIQFILFTLLTTNNVDELIKSSNKKSILEISMIQNTILLFIHNKDGKKQLI